MVRVVEDPTGSALVTDYLFDTLGNLRKTTQGDQNRYFMHSSIGRLLFAKQVEQDTNANLSATDPVTSNAAWSVKYEYDANGNITKTTDAKNWYVEGTYDTLNRIKERNYSDTATPDVYFYYDGKYKDASDTTQTATGSVKGKTTGIKSSVSKTNYTAFDFFGRPTAHQQMTAGNTYTTGYTYNLSGAMLTETYPSGRMVTHTLDQDGELAAVSSQTSGGISKIYLNDISRNSAGSITSMKLGNGRWENATYNSRQQITKIGLGNSATDTGLLKLEYKYDTTTTSYDNNGSMREQKITVPTVGGTSGFTATQTYTYDDLNRIQSATESISSTQTWKQTFEYDRYGNRRFNTTGSNTTTLGSCSAAVCNPTISASTNRISQSGYTFDANGNLTVDGSGNQFFYDAENHQKEVKDSGNNSLGTYYYDGEGRRVKKVAGSETTIFVYDGNGQMVAEYSTVTATTPQVSYLTQDHLGSPRVITNEIGAVTSRKDFSTFGETSTASQRSSGLGYQAPNLREDYTGYEKDAESGLEFAQARYYNPTHGRYTSIDPLTASASIKNPQTFNRYSYVLNSPYKFVDPLGLLSVTTGACGNWCPGGGGGGGGGFGIGPTTGMGGFAVEPDEPAPESESNAATATPATAGTTSAVSSQVEATSSAQNATPPFGSSSPTPEGSEQGGQGRIPTPAEIEKAIFEAINEVRDQYPVFEFSEKYLRALRHNEALSDYARQRAAEIQGASSNFDHDDFFANVVSEFKKRGIKSYDEAAEILVKPNTPMHGSTVKSIVSWSITAWKGSPGHFGAIISDDYQEVGVGAVYNPKDKTYYISAIFMLRDSKK